MISGGSDENDAVNRMQGYFQNCSSKFRTEPIPINLVLRQYILSFQ